MPSYEISYLYLWLTNKPTNKKTNVLFVLRSKARCLIIIFLMLLMLLLWSLTFSTHLFIPFLIHYMFLPFITQVFLSFSYLFYFIHNFSVSSSLHLIFFTFLFISHLPFYSSHSFLTIIPSLFRPFLFNFTFFPLFFASFLTFLSLCFVFYIPNFNSLSHSFLRAFSFFLFFFLFHYPVYSFDFIPVDFLIGLTSLSFSFHFLFSWN